jgi:hypothetical protein
MSQRFNAKLILPDGTEKPSLIVYFPPTLTGEEVEDIGRQILAVFSGTLCSDVEDEEGRGTTTEDMLDAGLLDGVPEAQEPSSALRDAAYDQIDRFLRNNMDDMDYADYSQALDLIYTTSPTPGVKGTRKCLYCERDVVPGIECVSKAHSESCDMRDGVLSADDSKGGDAAHVIVDLMRQLADALAARCGTNAEEWPLIERARKHFDGVAPAEGTSNG